MLDEPDERTIDWATAEELAFATILADGMPIRLTGEDVERGTFSQRHAVFHDANTGEQFIPLQDVPAGARVVRDPQQPAHRERGASASSSATTSRSRGGWCIWEAQYGDFINGAQVILDEFVTSGRAKWGLTPSLVFLLPHGYEGQGPEHSSARPERFLAGGRRHQHAPRQLHDRRAVLPPAAPAGRAARARSAAARSC